MFSCTSAANSCNAALFASCTTSAAVLNSCNAAASASRTRTRTAADNDLFYSLLEEGRRNPRPALAAADDDDDAAAPGGRREAKPAGCCPLAPAWKIAIRSFIATVSLLAEAFLVSLLPTCENWTDVFLWLASVVMIAMTGAIFWALTLDYFMDLEYHRKRRTHS